MRISVIITYILLTSIYANAQNFLINENFSNLKDTVPPSGWKNTTLSGDSTYDKFYFNSRIYHMAPPIDGGFAVFDAYNGGYYGGTATNISGEEVVLQLPDLNTVGLNNLFISFSKQTYVEQAAGIHFEVSVDTGKTWSSVWSEANNVIDGAPSSVELELKKYTGFNVLKTRFRWNNDTTLSYRGFFVLDNVQIFERQKHDVRPTHLVRMYDHACPDLRQPIEIAILNSGTDSVFNIPVKVLSASYSSMDTIAMLPPGETAYMVMPDSFNSSSGGQFTFTVIAHMAGDLLTTNDTILFKRNSGIPPASPNPKDVSRCGAGTVLLSTNRNKGDSTYWFAQATGGLEIGEGNPYETPVLDSTTDFYCENARINQDSMNTFAGLYRYNGAFSPGAMFNVSAKNDVIIDSLAQHFAYPGTYDMRVFIKDGTYKGSETTKGDWTELVLEKDTLLVSGYGRFYRFKLKTPLRIPAGSTTAFYVDSDRSSITFTHGNMHFENSDITVEGDAVLNNDFSGLSSDKYYWNGKLFYRKSCSDKRVKVTATVHAKPVGGDLLQGDTFAGNFRVGIERDPDIAAENKLLSYEIQPPAGYGNSDYGIIWKIQSVSLVSAGGVHVPDSDTVLILPGKSNGIIKYTTTSGWADSLIQLRVTLMETGNGCDSVLMRYIYIAPTPIPIVDFDHVCDGEAVSFLNYSKVSVGFLSYHWDFGDGNQSTSKEPIYTYDTFGTYQVTLTVTSDNDITSDTTFTVNVYEIPVADFSVESSCDSLPARFTNLSTISSGTLTYLWDFGDGSTSGTTNPVHQYATPKTYKVILEVYANGCVNKQIKNANLFARPKADFKVEGACSGNPIQFTNISTINSPDPIGSFWRFGDATVGTLRDIVHIYYSGDIYDVEMVAVTPFGCRDSVMKQITILPAPLADFSFEKACENLPVDFTNETKVPTGLNPEYTWYFGDGDSSDQVNPSHKYGVVAERLVTLKAGSVNGCITTAEKVLKVSAQPKASFLVNDGCSGMPVYFTNITKYSEGDIRYKWYFGDQDSSELTSPGHIYQVKSTSTFNVTLRAIVDEGCIDELNRAVTIEEPPVCSFTAVRSDSNRMIWSFYPDNDQYDPSFYTWVFEGSGVRHGIVNPVHLFEYPETEYRVILRVKTESGCECADSTTFITTSWGVGVEDQQTGKARVYPNPASEWLNLDNTSGEYVSDLVITDYSGKVVWSGRGEDSRLDGVHRIPVTGLASGIYFLRVLSENNHTVYQVMIEGR